MARGNAVNARGFGAVKLIEEIDGSNDYINEGGFCLAATGTGEVVVEALFPGNHAVTITLKPQEDIPAEYTFCGVPVVFTAVHAEGTTIASTAKLFAGSW